VSTFEISQIAEMFIQKEKKFHFGGNREYLEIICDIGIKHYLIQAEDVRKCPKNECTYSGFINKKQCHDNLECSEC
jgi:hypothetical protein